MKDDHAQFLAWRSEQTQLKARDEKLKSDLNAIQVRLDGYKYSYQFSWLGIPVIRFPDDLLVFQELVWTLKPKTIIEVGVARGGSVIFSSSLLHLVGENGRVLGIDIDIRDHNRERIESHQTSGNVTLVEGDSTSAATVAEVQQWLGQDQVADIIVLDSNHTHQHVLRELQVFAPLLRSGGYFVLPDTVIEFFPEGYYADRPWDRGNNPLTALWEFLDGNPDFEVDHLMSSKAAISESPFGYIRKM